MTFTLLTTSEGKKMGKTQAGALWLDADKTSPYEFYQYWRNVEDADVNTCLSILTFLPMEEVRQLSSLKDSEINRAKEVLAFEVTKLVHGEEEAVRAQDAARVLFGTPGASPEGDMENVPTSDLDRDRLKDEELGLVTIMREVGLVSSNGEGFRAIQQGGVTLNGEKVSDAKTILSENDFPDGSALIKKGKKSYCRVVLI
jgi:tyrosyl-tRNA synthetase